MSKLKLLLCAFAALIAATVMCSASAAEVGTVNAQSGLRLRTAASTSAGTVTIVETGAQLVVTEVGNAWCKVNYAGTEGYMSAEYLSHSPNAMFARPISGRITASVVNVRAGATTNSARLGQLADKTEVTIIGFTDGWYRIRYGNGEGFVHPDYVYATSAYLPSAKPAATAATTATAADTPTETPAEAPTDSTGDDFTPASVEPDEVDAADDAEAPTEVSGIREEVVAFAKSLIGAKYSAGGRSPSTGFDCSGFVYYVFKNFGYTLTPGASTQMDNVKVITKSELLPGDLVFFNNGSGRRASHVGIYIGDNQFVHAVRYGKPVCIESLSANYYTKYWVGGGRVLPVE